MNLENKLKRALNKNNREDIEKVFEEIYDQYYNLICFIINKYVNNRLDVEELANETFVNFYKRIFLVEIKDIKYYLVTSAKHISINHIQSQTRDQVEYNDEYIDTIHNDSNTEYMSIIMEMERYLSVEQINVILLHTVYDYSFKEIAKKHNSTESTIKTIYYRAIKSFKKGIKNEK